MIALESLKDELETVDLISGRDDLLTEVVHVVGQSLKFLSIEIHLGSEVRNCECILIDS